MQLLLIRKLSYGLQIYFGIVLEILLPTSTFNKLFAALTVTTLLGCSPNDSSSAQKDSDSDKEQSNLHVASPDWRDQIIYFLMIDRFEDGDPSNNDQGRGVYDPSKESHYNGGDIPGITQRLDYIQELGATSVWLTPPVANQWWSSDSEYSGYHGYWARNFKQVDEHYGTLEDYRNLSKALHARNMYLIQDIVVNHSGIFFGYDGEYDPTDTAKNFVLFEKAFQTAPENPPFDMVNRLNPEHAEAGIYNWTVPIYDYNDLNQQYTYQLGNLSDINTKNPQVVAAFKDIYKFWMNEVGVDAFRIDTVKYVEHEFWHHFLHDSDGIYAEAKKLNKSHFLTFGEVFDPSPVYSDSGEKKVASFLGTEQKPELNSVIGFPLYFEIGNVLGEGKPTKQLAYRLEQHMKWYPDPYVIPNFVDNHDTKRFLAGAGIDAFKQALALIFTIPGIPVVYQGSEQAMKETRQAMFEGGFLAEKDYFDTESEMFQFIKQMSQLRLSDKLFTRGSLQLLASDESGPGVLAFKREYQGRNAIVLMNTADHTVLLNGLRTGLSGNEVLKSLYSNVELESLNTSSAGTLNMALPPRTIAVLSGTGEAANLETVDNSDITISFDENIDGEVFNQDIAISGVMTSGATELKLILNGNLDRAITILSDQNGVWKATIPVRNLGETKYSLEAYAPKYGIATERQYFTALVETPEVSKSVQDAADDAKGPNGRYTQPQQDASENQMEIIQALAQTAGANMELTLTMQQISDVWGPANGFDNASLTIFFDLPNQQGMQVLPLINAQMPEALNWDLAHVAYGWGNYMYRTEHAAANEPGVKVGISPQVQVDKAANTIKFIYRGDQLGIDNWKKVSVYITTWDISGEGAYRDLSPEGGEWSFGGAEANSPKILDDVLIQL